MKLGTTNWPFSTLVYGGAIWCHPVVRRKNDYADKRLIQEFNNPTFVSPHFVKETENRILFDLFLSGIIIFSVRAHKIINYNMYHWQTHKVLVDTCWLNGDSAQ